MDNTRRPDKKAIREHMKQLLRQRYPNFDGLPKKKKKELLEICELAVKELRESESKFDGVPEMTQSERLGLGKMPENLMTVSEIDEVIEETGRFLFDLGKARRNAILKDPLLVSVDELIDDHVLNRLLSPPGFTPTMRTWMPCHYFRTELLRTMKYPELSVRKFCEEMKKKKKCAEERAFCGMDWKGATIDHSSLSNFRRTLTLEMCVNLMTYVTVLFLRSGRLEKSGVFALDSTDVAVQIESYPLSRIEVSENEFINFYGELDCDCGARRKKRDKSERFVGYRVHTLCAIDPDTKHAFPFISLAVAANHHDSQVLSPIIDIAQAIGLEIKVLLGDDAYADIDKKKDLLENSDIMLVTPEKEKNKKTVDGTDPSTGEVRLSTECPVPMKWDGYDQELHGHVFVCGDENNECIFQHRCEKEKYIPLDSGAFGPIPKCIELGQTPLELRKVAERPFNLMKHMDGMEPCRMRRKASVTAQVTFSHIAGIMKVMAGQRSRKTRQSEKRPIQKELQYA